MTWLLIVPVVLVLVFYLLILACRGRAFGPDVLDSWSGGEDDT